MEERGMDLNQTMQKLMGLKQVSCNKPDISTIEILDSIFPAISDIKISTRLAKFFQNKNFDSDQLNIVLKPYKEYLPTYTDWVIFGDSVTGKIGANEVKFQLLSNINKAKLNALTFPEGVEGAILDPFSGKIVSVNSGEDINRFADNDGRIYVTFYNEKGEEGTISCISVDPSTLQSKAFIPLAISPIGSGIGAAGIQNNENFASLSEEQKIKLQEHLNIFAIQVEINAIKNRALKLNKTVDGEDLIRLNSLQKSLEALTPVQAMIVDKEGNLVWETNKDLSVEKIQEKVVFKRKQTKEIKRGRRLSSLAVKANKRIV